MTTTSEAPVDVVVIGAAGQTGRPLVRALVGRGAKVKALVHRPDQAQQVREAAAVEAVDLADVHALAGALAGAATVHYIPPVFSAREEEYGANVISAALGAGGPRLVYHSVLHAHTPAMPHHHRKARVEVALRDSTLAWTILQPAMYAQTPLAFLNAARTRLTIGFDPRRPFTPVDLEDLAEAAAAVLLNAGHEYATYELAGAEKLGFNQMGEVISRALGREVSVHALPSAVVAGVAATHFGPRAVFDVKAMLDHYDAHGLVGNPNVLRTLLGRQPTPFEDVIQRELGVAA